MSDCTCDDIIIEMTEEGLDGNGIVRFELIDETVTERNYRIVLSNGTYFDYTVDNGIGISKIEELSHIRRVHTIRITLTDNSTFDYTVTDGEKGDSATIAVGTVTTLPAGSPATVTNSGDENNAVFDFGIPQGAKGDKGDTGEVTYVLFQINAETGQLQMNVNPSYVGPTFQLNNGYLEVYN